MINKTHDMRPLSARMFLAHGTDQGVGPGTCNRRGNGSRQSSTCNEEGQGDGAGTLAGDSDAAGYYFYNRGESTSDGYGQG